MTPSVYALLFALAFQDGTASVAGDVPDDVVELETIDERMAVPVRIGAAGPYRFVVDTGAERTVVARRLAEALSLPNGRRVRVTSMSDTSVVDSVRIAELSVDGVGRVGELLAPALDGAHLGADGLVGLDALAGRRVSIDFVRRRMTVRKAERRMPRPGPDEVVVTARSRLGQLIVTDAAFGGRRVRVIVDTGASISVGNLALRRLVARRAAATTRARFVSVTGGTVEADYAFVSRLRIGAIELSNVPVAFADAQPFVRLDLLDRPTLLLGMDALRAFRAIDIDFANREIRIGIMPADEVQRTPPA